MLCSLKRAPLLYELVLDCTKINPLLLRKRKIQIVCGKQQRARSTAKSRKMSSLNARTQRSNSEGAPFSASVRVLQSNPEGPPEYAHFKTIVIVIAKLPSPMLPVPMTEFVV